MIPDMNEVGLSYFTRAVRALSLFSTMVYTHTRQSKENTKVPVCAKSPLSKKFNKQPASPTFVLNPGSIHADVSENFGLLYALEEKDVCCLLKQTKR